MFPAMSSEHTSWLPIWMSHMISNSAGSKLNRSLAPQSPSTFHSWCWSEIAHSAQAVMPETWRIMLDTSLSLAATPKHHMDSITLKSLLICLSPPSLLLQSYFIHHGISLRQIQQSPKWSLCLQKQPSHTHLPPCGPPPTGSSMLSHVPPLLPPVSGFLFASRKWKWKLLSRVQLFANPWTV